MYELSPITLSSVDYRRISSLLESIRKDSPFIWELYDEIDRADILEPDQMPADVAQMNRVVRFMNEETKKIFTGELAYPDQVDDASEMISILTPAGTALLGLKAGDSIKWPLFENKALHLKLIEVL